jgi:undecaprenol kinase
MARFRRSMGFAWKGIFLAVRGERHMRFHLSAAVCVCLAAALLEISRLEWALLAGACGLVLTAELFNTAVERAVDLTTAELHPLAKAAKDTAAGAVLTAVVFAVIIGLIVLGPPFYAWIERML